MIYLSKVEELSNGLAAGKEKVIKDAITHHMGTDDWTMDIVGRCKIIHVADGSEIFVIDDSQLVRFFPPITNVDHKNEGIFMNITQKYRLLY